MAQEEQINVKNLLHLNQQLARVNARASEVVATMELKEEENRQLNESLAKSNAWAAELVAEREEQLHKLVALNAKLREVITEKDQAYARLRKAMDEIRNLQSILPICSFCKKIRDDTGYWDEVDDYIAHHSETRFSHSICPSCLDSNYPED